jgi:tRNA(Arg) A34 adenosine deaminase TadA
MCITERRLVLPHVEKKEGEYIVSRGDLKAIKGCNYERDQVQRKGNVKGNVCRAETVIHSLLHLPISMISVVWLNHSSQTQSKNRGGISVSTIDEYFLRWAVQEGKEKGAQGKSSIASILVGQPHHGSGIVTVGHNRRFDGPVYDSTRLAQVDAIQRTGWRVMEAGVEFTLYCPIAPGIQAADLMRRSKIARVVALTPYPVGGEGSLLPGYFPGMGFPEVEVFDSSASTSLAREALDLWNVWTEMSRKVKAYRTADGKLPFGDALLRNANALRKRLYPNLPSLPTREVDEYFMGLAVQEAGKSLDGITYPIGCVIVGPPMGEDGQWIICPGRNHVYEKGDLSAHAEIDAMRRMGSLLLLGYSGACTLYTTMEPCMMCMEAIRLAGIRRVVYLWPDPTGLAGNALREHFPHLDFPILILYEGRSAEEYRSEVQRHWEEGWSPLSRAIKYHAARGHRVPLRLFRGWFK